MERRVSKAETSIESESPAWDDLEHPINNEKECLNALEHVINKLSTYLEHKDHCESTNDADIDIASQRLIKLAVILAQRQGVHLPTIYADRLFQIEEANIGIYHTLNQPGVTNPTGAARIARAESWRDFQVGQFIHDQEFHLQILGNPQHDQLRHYTFHIAKLPHYLSTAVNANNLQSFIDSGALGRHISFWY